MSIVKGVINIQNFHKVTANVVNNGVSDVVDVTVGSVNTVVEESINMTNKFTKLITGKEDIPNEKSKMFGISQMEKMTSAISNGTKKIVNNMIPNIGNDKDDKQNDKQNKPIIEKKKKIKN